MRIFGQGGIAALLGGLIGMGSTPSQGGKPLLMQRTDDQKNPIYLSRHQHRPAQCRHKSGRRRARLRAKQRRS